MNKRNDPYSELSRLPNGEKVRIETVEGRSNSITVRPVRMTKLEVEIRSQLFTSQSLKR